MQAVGKRSFPTLLKTLWESKTTSHLVNGFNRSRLSPFDRNAISVDKCVKEVEELADENTLAITPCPDTPQVSTTGNSGSHSPPSFSMQQEAAEIAKKKHKRVQAKEGEVLTTPEVLRRLQEEAKTRQAKTEKLPKKRRKALVDVMNINDLEEQESNEISEDSVAFM